MPFNGSGGTSQPTSSIYPAVASTLIESAKFNISIADIYTMLASCVLKDGQQTATAVIPFAQGIKTDDISENTAGEGVTIDGALLKDGRIDTAQGSDIASASTINLETATGNVVDVTGTTAITAVTLSQGHWRLVRFTGALKITNGASLVTGTGGDIFTSAGDYAMFVGYASSVVRIAFYVHGSAWATGDVKVTLKTTADPGWVLMDDKTIGDASSSATGRANADTEGLFTLLWTNTADAECAVSTGRGASASADFAAHKTIALPKALGRTLAVYGAGSGLTSRALAKSLGSEDAINVSHTHTGTTASDGAHTHIYDQGGAGATNNGYTGTGIHDPAASTSSNGAHTHTFTTDSSGSSGTGANMPPTTFLNVMVKL